MVAVTSGNVYKALVQFTLLVIAFALMGESLSMTTTTQPPTTRKDPVTTDADESHTTRNNGCLYEGKWYLPGEKISQGYDGENWCFGVVCDENGQVLYWDNFNCGTTAPTTTPHTTSELATTTPPPPVTTPIPFTTPLGCFQNGKWYRPGEQMSRGFDGKNWCYGTYCDRNGQVVAWDDWTCGTTTTPTTNIPTSTPPLPTKRRGCFQNGKWYRPGEEMSRGFDGKNWCHGTYCDRYGQVVTWDNFNCGPTTVSTTHAPTTTPTTHAPTTTPTTHEPTTTPTTHEPTTTPTTHEPTTIPSTLAPTVIARKANKIPHRFRSRGCYYRGNRYEPNSNILQSTNGNGWCYGKRCSDDNQVILWDDFTCQPRKSGGCWYGGYRYAYGSELFRVRNQFLCYGGVCGKNGKINSWSRMSCRKEMQFYGGRLKPSWCKYRGERYPRGSVFAVRSLSKRHGFGWCIGAKCVDNGRIVTWGPKWAPGYC